MSRTALNAHRHCMDGGLDRTRKAQPEGAVTKTILAVDCDVIALLLDSPLIAIVAARERKGSHMPHALAVAVEICLGYVAFSFFCTGIWGALVFRRDRVLEAERPLRAAAALRPYSPERSPVLHGRTGPALRTIRACGSSLTSGSSTTASGSSWCA